MTNESVCPLCRNTNGEHLVWCHRRKTPAERRQEVIDEIWKELQRQDEKWGEQNHDPLFWMAILMEEIGEASKAIIEGPGLSSSYRDELVQVAAVAIAAIESWDRNP